MIGDNMTGVGEIKIERMSEREKETEKILKSTKQERGK